MSNNQDVLQNTHIDYTTTKDVIFFNTRVTIRPTYIII